MANRESFPVTPIKINAVIDFGSRGDTTAKVILTGYSWITADSVIVPIFSGETSDHGPDDALAEGLTLYIENLKPGIGFDITAAAPDQSGTKGRYAVVAILIA